MAQSPVLGLQRARVSGCGATVQSTMHGPEHQAQTWKSLTHQALVALAPGHQPFAEALATDRVTRAALSHRATGVTLAPCTENQRCPVGLSHAPKPGRSHPGTYAGSPAGWWR